MSDALSMLRPRREVDGISAVFTPCTRDGEPDLDAFAEHLQRTVDAGLVPALNMDTGFGPQIGPDGRARVLAAAAQVLTGSRFVAAAMPFGHDGDPVDAYRREAQAVAAAGGTPIVFPSDAIASLDASGVAALHARVLDATAGGLAFELSPAFAPFGRIYDIETFRALLDVEAVRGAKHSSLRRDAEWRRLAERDERRPDFRVYTGNDLAIDMVMYGSDYLLGLSTFEPEAFSLRDRWWALGDDRFFELNDALQALGAFAFREPVPGYKSSAAAYLRLCGRLPGALEHPSTPRRPAWESDVLRRLAERVASAASADG